MFKVTTDVAGNNSILMTGNRHAGADVEMSGRDISVFVRAYDDCGSDAFNIFAWVNMAWGPPAQMLFIGTITTTQNGFPIFVPSSSILDEPQPSYTGDRVTPVAEGD